MSDVFRINEDIRESHAYMLCSKYHLEVDCNVLRSTCYMREPASVLGYIGPTCDTYVFFTFYFTCLSTLLIRVMIQYEHSSIVLFQKYIFF